MTSRCVTPRGITGILSLLFALAIAQSSSSAENADEKKSAEDLTPTQVFENRIMPIFRSPNPSSCVQCHLSSVDIKDYILPSHTATFVALRDNGLINISDPSKSKILTLIQMGEKDTDQSAKRIHEKTRKAEYEAFATWITKSCDDEALLSLPAVQDSQSVGPEKPIEVVRHARKSSVVESFTRNIWSQRMRCFPCHTPNEIDDANPKHVKPKQRHQEYVQTYGRRMNLFRETPEATLSAMIASSRNQTGKHLPLINLAQPANSLLILKPTAKLPPKNVDGMMQRPSSAAPVSHMGGLKMHVNDHSYKLFMSWLEDYASIAAGEYTSVDQLPTDNWLPTKRILRLKDAPDAWGTGTVVQLFVFPADSPSEKPIAFTQGSVTPRKMVNGALILIQSNRNNSHGDSEQPSSLTPGRYVIKAFVDTDGRISKSPTMMLDSTDLAGTVVIDANWEIGFPNAETFSASALEK